MFYGLGGLGLILVLLWCNYSLYLTNHWLNIHHPNNSYYYKRTNQPPKTLTTPPESTPHFLFKHHRGFFNPLSPKIYQHQRSLCNIFVIVTRIKGLITQDEFNSYSATSPHYFYSKCIETTNENLYIYIRVNGPDTKAGQRRLTRMSYHLHTSTAKPAHSSSLF